MRLSAATQYRHYLNHIKIHAQHGLRSALEHTHGGQGRERRLPFIQKENGNVGQGKQSEANRLTYALITAVVRLAGNATDGYTSCSGFPSSLFGRLPWYDALRKRPSKFFICVHLTV